MTQGGLATMLAVVVMRDQPEALRKGGRVQEQRRLEIVLYDIPRTL